jgi:hypothetical protein
MPRLSGSERRQSWRDNQFLNQFVNELKGSLREEYPHASRLAARRGQSIPQVLERSGKSLPGGLYFSASQPMKGQVSDLAATAQSGGFTPQEGVENYMSSGEVMSQGTGSGGSSTPKYELGKEDWLAATANSPAAQSGAFTDDQLFNQQLKHRQWLADNNRI